MQDEINELFDNPSQFFLVDGIDFQSIEESIKKIAQEMDFDDENQKRLFLAGYTDQLKHIVIEAYEQMNSNQANQELQVKRIVDEKQSVNIRINTQITKKEIQLIKNDAFELPNHIVMETDMLSKDIWNGKAQRELEEKKDCLRIKQKVDKKEHIVTSFFIWDIQANKKGGWQFEGRILTEFERRVHDAYVSLLLVKDDGPLNHVCTVEMIYRVMYGIPNGVIQMTKKQIDDINRAMHLLGTLRVKIDATDEDRLIKRYANITSFQCNATIINVKCVELNEDSSLDGIYYIYQSNDMPPLYEYAARKKQLHSLPITSLSRIKGVNNTVKNTKLRNWFERRIDSIKYSERMSDVILVETLMHELGYIEEGQKKSDYDKRKRNLLYKKIEQILNYFVDTKQILGYEWLKNNKNLRDKKYKIKINVPKIKKDKPKWKRYKK